MINENQNEIDILKWVKILFKKKLLFIISFFITFISIASALIIKNINKEAVTITYKPVFYNSDLHSSISTILNNEKGLFFQNFGFDLNYSISSLYSQDKYEGQLSFSFTTRTTNNEDIQEFLFDTVKKIETQRIMWYSYNYLEEAQQTTLMLNRKINNLLISKDIDMSEYSKISFPSTVYQYNTTPGEEDNFEYLILYANTLSKTDRESFIKVLIETYQQQKEYYLTEIETEWMIISNIENLIKLSNWNSEKVFESVNELNPIYNDLLAYSYQLKNDPIITRTPLLSTTKVVKFIILSIVLSLIVGLAVVYGIEIFKYLKEKWDETEV